VDLWERQKMMQLICGIKEMRKCKYCNHIMSARDWYCNVCMRLKIIEVYHIGLMQYVTMYYGNRR
jgi:hypothetical protein